MKKFSLLISFLFLLLVNFFCSSSPDQFDLIIKSGNIVDGTGGEVFQADIGIIGDRIVKIGKIPKSNGTEIIEAENFCVAPGFIDVHTHADRRIDTHPFVKNYILQGVTTVVGGNCGGSRFPLEEMFKKVENQGIAINFASYVGHNTIRREVMGIENRKPKENEMDQMKQLVSQEMLSGAIGLSTGLEYIPGRFSSIEEIIELAKVTQPYDGVYASHLRDQGEKIREAIEETIEIGRQADVTVQIAHIKLKIEKSWGKLHLITDPIENALSEGMEVYMDEYPYTAGSTGFTSSFPEWAVTGGHEAFVERLKNPENYKKIKDFIVDFRFTSSREIDKSKMIYVTRNRNHPEYEGKNLAEILELLGREQNISNAADLFIELENNDRPSAIFFQTDEKDVIALMQKDYTMVGSDGGIQIPGKEITHPRAYGTFSKIISKFVREKKALTLPDAVRKMTSLPAKAMGFKDRGIIKENKFADLVIFDLNTITEKSTYEDPHQFPEGIKYVIVNGKISAQDGEITGVKEGKILYGKGKTEN